MPVNGPGPVSRQRGNGFLVQAETGKKALDIRKPY